MSNAEKTTAERAADHHRLVERERMIGAMNERGVIAKWVRAQATAENDTAFYLADQIEAQDYKR